jgi:hypothetical protein
MRTNYEICPINSPLPVGYVTVKRTGHNFLTVEISSSDARSVAFHIDSAELIAAEIDCRSERLKMAGFRPVVSYC